MTPRRRALAVLAVSVLLVAAAWLAYTLAWPIGATWLGLLAGLGVGGMFGALLLWMSPDGCDVGTPAQRSRYLREFLPAMFGYLVTVFVSIWLLKRVDEPGLRVLLALLPVPPIAMALRAIMRYIRDADELQRRIELEAVSFATAAISLLYLAGGFLQSAEVIDIPASDAMLWVFPLVCVIYGLSKVVISRRFQ